MTAFMSNPPRQPNSNLNAAGMERYLLAERYNVKDALVLTDTAACALVRIARIGEPMAKIAQAASEMDTARKAERSKPMAWPPMIASGLVFEHTYMFENVTGAQFHAAFNNNVALKPSTEKARISEWSLVLASARAPWGNLIWAQFKRVMEGRIGAGKRVKKVFPLLLTVLRAAKDEYVMPETNAEMTALSFVLEVIARQDDDTDGRSDAARRLDEIAKRINDLAEREPRASISGALLNAARAIARIALEYDAADRAHDGVNTDELARHAAEIQEAHNRAVEKRKEAEHTAAAAA